MFIEQDPQIPSLQDRRKVSVGSISFLILISASRIWSNHNLIHERHQSKEVIETNHWASLIQVNGVGLQSGFLRRLVRILQYNVNTRIPCPRKTTVEHTQRYILNSFCKTGFCVGTACHLDADETKVRTEAGRSDCVRMSDAAMVCMVLMKEGSREFGQSRPGYIGRSLAQSGTFGMST